MSKKFGYYATLMALITATIILLADRTSGKKYTDLYPAPENFDSCQICYLSDDRVVDVTLTGKDLEDFISILAQPQYYKDGFYGSIIEGTLYHVFFHSQQAEGFSVKFSDQAALYIGPYRYSIRPDIISGYIEEICKGKS